VALDIMRHCALHRGFPFNPRPHASAVGARRGRMQRQGHRDLAFALYYRLPRKTDTEGERCREVSGVSTDLLSYFRQSPEYVGPDQDFRRD
jgi:hypothetical protein